MSRLKISFVLQLTLLSAAKKPDLADLICGTFLTNFRLFTRGFIDAFGCTLCKHDSSQSLQKKTGLDLQLMETQNYRKTESKSCAMLQN